VIKYIAISVVKNEERNISDMVGSVLNQTIPPRAFIIIDGGSTDRTQEILERLFKPYPSTLLLPLVVPDDPKLHKWENQRNATHLAVKVAETGTPDWEWLLTIDGDVVLPPDYVERLTSDLWRYVGIVSGVPHGGSVWRGRASNVARLYRRECWEQINGLAPVLHWDTWAILEAYRWGFLVRSDPTVKFIERRPSTRESLHEWYLSGWARHFLGFPLPHTVFAGLTHISENPPILGALVMFFTQLVLSVTGRRRPFDKDYYKKTRNIIIKEMKQRILEVL